VEVWIFLLKQASLLNTIYLTQTAPFTGQKARHDRVFDSFDNTVYFIKMKQDGLDIYAKKTLRI